MVAAATDPQRLPPRTTSKVVVATQLAALASPPTNVGENDSGSMFVDAETVAIAGDKASAPPAVANTASITTAAHPDAANNVREPGTVSVR